MKEYFDMYLKIDALLLACVSEIFKTKSIYSFELDLAHYLSTPCYSWNPVLTLTDVNLILISDVYIEEYQFIESIIIGVFLWFVKDILKVKINS